MFGTQPSCAHCRGFSFKQFFTELWDFFFHYIFYRDLILSAQVLQYYWREFNETLQKCLLPSLVVHSVGVFHSSNFCQSYGTLLFFHYILYRDLILSAQVLQYYWREFNETSQKCLVQSLVVPTVGVFVQAIFQLSYRTLFFFHYILYRDIILSAQVLQYH